MEVVILEIKERIDELNLIKSGKDPVGVRAKKDLAKLVREIPLGYTLEYSGCLTETLAISRLPSGIDPKIKIHWFTFGIQKDFQETLETSEELDYMSLYAAKAISDFITRDDMVVNKYQKTYSV